MAERKAANKWIDKMRKSQAAKKSLQAKDVERGVVKDKDNASIVSNVSLTIPKLQQTKELKKEAIDMKIVERVSIERGKLGKIPFNVDIDELCILLPNLNEVPFCDTMPVVNVNYSTKHFGIKARLNELIQSEIHGKLNEKWLCNTIFERLITKATSGNQTEKPNLQVNCKEKLRKALQLLGSHRLQYLMDLYSFDVPFECPYNFESHTEESKFQRNRRFRENMKLIFEYLKTSSSDFYNQFLANILTSNNVSITYLNDEHCLFTMRFDYAKVTVESLRDTLKLFFPEKKGFANKTQVEQGDREKEEESKDIRIHDLIRFETSDRMLLPKKRRNYYAMLLDESVFVSVEVVRDLLLFMVVNIHSVSEIKETSFDDKQQTFGLATELQKVDNHSPLDIKMNEAFIKDIPEKMPTKQTKFSKKLKNRLNAFIDIMKEKKVITSVNLLEIDKLMQQVWDNLVKTLKELNEHDAAYIAETRCGRTRQLQNSAAFIARKYLHRIIYAVQSSVVTFLTNNFKNLPSTWANNVQLLKVKMDILIDNAFIHHLKDSAIATLSFLGLKEIKLPEYGKRLHEPVEATTIRDTVSNLIALVKYKMLVGETYKSPLYEEMVVDMKIYSSNIRNEGFLNDLRSNFPEMFNEQIVYNKHSPEAVKKSVADETSDIIEKDMLLRYMYMEPQLECLQQVAEIGADLVLDIGMKRSVRDV